MKECNKCDRKKCPYVSRNIFPKVKNKPTKYADYHHDEPCSQWVPIVPTGRLKDIARIKE